MIVGLTGGIGSGKSTVAKLFGVLGCKVFNSDDAAKSAYQIPAVREKVIHLLGQEAYHGEVINRPYIASLVFENGEELKALNAILHPAVGELFKQFVARHQGQIIIKESALLFEAGVTAGLDLILVVAAPDELRIERVMKRDKTSRESVLNRMRHQMPQDEKIKRADLIIRNDETHSLILQAQDLVLKLKKGKSA